MNSRIPRSRLVAALLLAGLCLGPAPSSAQTDNQSRADGIGEPVSFADGSTTLSGSLLIPSGPGPHPAFVAIEGSGGASFRLGWTEGYFPFWKEISEFLVEQGYAVLLFDKPGVNESSGDWRRQSFDDRAVEVISAVRHLADRDDIDAGRIGLVGHSQGGWIAQIAAARHPDEVGFLILLAGPAISVRQQIRDDVVNGWTCRGISGFGHAVRRSGLDLGLAMLSLVSYVAKPGYLSRIIHFDPRHDLPDIQQPTLALFAEHDPLVVPAPNRSRLEQHFGTATQNPRLQVATVPGANHFFRSSSWCPGEDRPGGWAPGFFQALESPEYWGWVQGLG